MPLKTLLAITAIALALAPDDAFAGTAADRPNILIIYADDVGVGDVAAYGETTTQTPRLDALAESGVRFTRGYATDATFTPSRYSLLTGAYPFRNRKAQILNSDSALLIEPGTPTLASILGEAGYHTAMIGKWHLGLGDGQVDWNTDISPGPLDIGFKESFILPSTNDRVPTVLIEGRRVIDLDLSDPLKVSFSRKVGNEPTGVSHPHLLTYGADGYHSGTIVNGISRIGWQSGGKAAWWDDELLTSRFVDRFRHVADRRTEAGAPPFFAFVSLHQVHTPRIPAPPFVGNSQTGLRGDAMLELDWAVGEMVDLLEERGLLDNTLIVFSSDNGAIFWDAYDDGAVENANGHSASGEARGGKYQPFEGGCRVPFIVHFPGRAKPGVSEAMVSQVDLFRSIAKLVGVALHEGAAPDSQDHLATFLGASEVGRDYIVQSAPGVIAIREGPWKLVPAGPRPEWTIHKHNSHPNPLTSPAASTQTLLYNLDADPGETTNLAPSHPKIVARLTALLEGVKQQPDAKVERQ